MSAAREAALLLTGKAPPFSLFQRCHSLLKKAGECAPLDSSRTRLGSSLTQIYPQLLEATEDDHSPLPANFLGLRHPRLNCYAFSPISNEVELLNQLLREAALCNAASED